MHEMTHQCAINHTVHDSTIYTNIKNHTVVWSCVVIAIMTDFPDPREMAALKTRMAELKIKYQSARVNLKIVAVG